MDGSIDGITQCFCDGSLSINDVDCFGSSLLHGAVAYLHPAVLEWLLDNGADINATNDSGETVIFELQNMSTELYPRGWPQQPLDEIFESYMILLVERCHGDDLGKYRVDNWRYIWRPLVAWGKKQLQIVRFGVDLHSEVGEKTVLGFILSNQHQRVHPSIPYAERIFDWFCLLHKAGNINVADYLKKEHALHPGGEVCEGGQSLLYYHEHQVFKVEYNNDLN